MTLRENFLSVMNFEKPDRFPVMEFMGFWPEVEKLWQKQGLPENVNIFDYFGLVNYKFLDINFNFVPPFEEKILEETDSHLIVIDPTGVTKKIEKNSSAMPHYIDFPIKGRKDFESIKERMSPADYKKRYPQNWDSLVQEYKTRDYPIGLIIRGPFAFCRDFINFEQLMMLAYDDIGLLNDMMSFQVDFTIWLWEKALKDVDVDFIYLGEDMAYKNGPMFSPDLCRSIIAPQYKRLTDFLRQHRVKNIILDSDGCIWKLLDMFVECGITGILPLERVAGMDPIKIRKEFPRLQMIGGIDKLKIAEGDAGIKQEIKIVKELVGQGGWIPSFDHSVPPIVSFENYFLYINMLKNMLV